MSGHTAPFCLFSSFSSQSLYITWAYLPLVCVCVSVWEREREREIDVPEDGSKARYITSKCTFLSSDCLTEQRMCARAYGPAYGQACVWVCEWAGRHVGVYVLERERERERAKVLVWEKQEHAQFQKKSESLLSRYARERIDRSRERKKYRNFCLEGERYRGKKIEMGKQGR